MAKNESIFDDTSSNDAVPDYLKNALLSEVNNIRDTMQVVNHFTEVFLSTALSFIGDVNEDDMDLDDTNIK